MSPVCANLSVSIVGSEWHSDISCGDAWLDTRNVFLLESIIVVQKKKYQYKCIYEAREFYPLKTRNIGYTVLAFVIYASCIAKLRLTNVRHNTSDVYKCIWMALIYSRVVALALTQIWRTLLSKVFESVRDCCKLSQESRKCFEHQKRNSYYFHSEKISLSDESVKSKRKRATLKLLV